MAIEYLDLTFVPPNLDYLFLNLLENSLVVIALISFLNSIAFGVCWSCSFLLRYIFALGSYCPSVFVRLVKLHNKTFVQVKLKANASMTLCNACFLYFLKC